MIDQKQMAQAYKDADERISKAKVKANGYYDGNAIRATTNQLKDALIAAGVTQDGAWKLACSWASKSSKAVK